MATVLRRLRVAEEPPLEVQVIVAEDRVWLRLVRTDSDKLSRVWSTRAEPNRAPLTEADFARQLKHRLALVAAGELDLDDALQFWAEGWDYWGSGMPNPIFDFVSSSEFRTQVDGLSPIDVE